MNIPNNYDEYLKSSKWQRIKEYKLKKANYQCQLCGEKRERLEVHHNNYKNIYNETETDLIVLCRSCHEWHHIDKEEKAIILAALISRESEEYFENDVLTANITRCNNHDCKIKHECFRYSEETKGNIFQFYYVENFIKCDHYCENPNK